MGLLTFATSRSHEHRCGPGIGTQRAGDAQTQCAAPILQQRLHTGRHRKRMPAAAPRVHRFLRQKLLPRTLLQEQPDVDISAGAVALWQSKKEPDVGLLH